ncbi:ABC transporter permease [Dyella flagellata]|uniref:ABC transporter ATP-binding protein n=1 Tax=Dyella flagellata TaxID=1867833 RepID=A0ABQ5XBL6_9GAMM|nr:ABC transporter permease [Dyella flagellata]GLQ88692.1 ABC transporter ATP-binding protein [Dyella flagellata]
MLGYYAVLAIRSLSRDIALTLLMVLTIAIGIGASMTALTVYHVLARDPYPGRSGKLFRPQLDPRQYADRSKTNLHAGAEEPYIQLSWIDAMNLLHAHRADRQAVMSTGSFRVELPDGKVRPSHSFGLYTTTDFFPMFGAPFRYGAAWSEADDERGTRVVVITDTLNDMLFGGANSVGHIVVLRGVPFRVVGVLDHWQILPRIYGSYQAIELSDVYEAYIPLTSAIDADLHPAGSRRCWDEKVPFPPDNRQKKTAPCAWLQMWVQLDSAAKVAAYRDFLIHYSEDQKAIGRFQRPPNVRLRSVTQWLEAFHAVPDDARVQVWLAFGFLLVCLINATGLMLAKFMRGIGNVGVRRAMGASRRAVFAQLLVEAGMIGVAGGLIGLVLAYGGLWLLRQQQDGDIDYATLVHMDVGMLIISIVIALASSLLVGLLPAWRACQVSPALQLKTQ